ncbi:quercetin 2 [Aspergillus bombycis]|uniref:Quercetin 2 n=1 Tax=Aspergillus bombycis TaxID=109264 RepID=A0A1F8A0T9_9EURO|nr:quercetin 2 [Aspergillus bombycis]OGM45340.1 quercetin 2 [Aspergillus bombycis]
MKSPFAPWMLSILLLTPFAATDSVPSNKSIIVDTAPNFVRPYVLPKYKGDAIKLTSSQTIRFSITANSSDGAFSLLQHNGKASGWLSARPHTHGLTHEHLYCTRGRCQLWGQKNVTNSSHEARVATPGDYGNIPPGSIHTFQLVDPDSQLTHVFHPGGFEKLFNVFSQGEHDTHGISSPYVPIPDDPSPFGPMTPQEYNRLVSLDLYAAPEEEYIPRRDFVNGTAGEAKQSWHDGPNTPPNDPTTPYFVAKDYGPKYLNTDIGYKVIQPLATPAQTDGNFTMGTIIMSSKLANESVSTATLPHHFALQMEEGQLALRVQGYEWVHLLHGDVAFVPAGVSFSYYATVPYTKFMYMNAGGKGLEYQLLRRSVAWEFPAYPVFPGFRANTTGINPTQL